MIAHSRWIFLGMAVACAGLLGFGYYLQYVQHLDPCPMCIFQRLAYMATIALALVAAIHGPGTLGTRIYAGLIVMTTLTGGAIAGRQTWLQHLPKDQVPECGPGLEFMLDVYPLFEVIQKALKGTGECAEAGWRFLTLSIAEWSLLWFVLLTVIASWLLFHRRLAR